MAPPEAALLPTEFEVHPEMYYRTSISSLKEKLDASKPRPARDRDTDRAHVKATALALSCAMYDADPVRALSTDAALRRMHSLDSAYFCAGLGLGSSDREPFLVGVEGSRAYISFTGTQMSLDRVAEHVTQMADFELTSFGPAQGGDLFRSLAESVKDKLDDYRGMAGYMRAMNKVTCDIAYFLLKGFTHVIVTGHSRGGTIAFLKLVKYFLANKVLDGSPLSDDTPHVEAIAFGSPYCVNRSVVDYLTDRNLTLRFTTVANTDDIVTAIIPSVRELSPEMFQRFFGHIRTTSSSLVAVCMDMAKKQLEDIANDKKRFDVFCPLGSYEFLHTDGTTSSCFGPETVDTRLTPFIAKYIEANSDQLFSPHLVKEYINRACVAYGVDLSSPDPMQDTQSVAEPSSIMADNESQRGDVISLMPEVSGVSGEVFKNGSYTALKLTIFGENLDFMEPVVKTVYCGRAFEFKANRIRPRQLVFSSISKDFDLYAGENQPFIFTLQPVWTRGTPYRNDTPLFSLFTPHVGVEALLQRMFKVRHLLRGAGRAHFDACTAYAAARLLRQGGVDADAEDAFEELCSTRHRLEAFVAGAILPRCLKKVTVQTKLAKNIEFAGKLVLGLAVGAGVAFGGMMFFAGALEGGIVAGAVSAGLVTNALSTVEILQKEVEQSQQYIETITSIGELIGAEFPDGNLEFYWEDSIVARLVAMGVESADLVSKKVFPDWLTDDCRSRLVERVQTIWAIRDLRKFMNKTLCVSLLGVEKVGKTTAGIYLFKHMAEQITFSELKGHTSSVKIYRHDSVLVADFPGTNSKTESFNLATEQYLSITDVAIVFLNLNISLQKSDFELLTQLKKIRIPVLICMNKAGNSYKKRGSGRVNYFKTWDMVQERRHRWREQLLENDFDISNWTLELVELDKTEWYKEDNDSALSSKGLWLDEIGVWNIQKVRKWIRERKLRHDGQADFAALDQVMPDDNLWWSIERDEDGVEEVIGWS
ncbi:hypothetical protein BC830DRAFT_1121104 [Chytriomyces sp. MP71]|nr:hypothetical protein BC830DRAFT_1121104 [Chytriomyces sp. MP71]